MYEYSDSDSDMISSGVDDEGLDEYHMSQPIHNISPAFLEASRTGDLDTVRQALESEAKTECLEFVDSSNKRSALHLATLFGHSDVVYSLLNNGAKCNTKDVHGFTPLHLACVNGHVAIAEMLLRHGAKANPVDCMGETPLHIVCRKSGREDLVAVLIQNGCAVDGPREMGKKTPLGLAAAHGNITVVARLLDLGANIEKPDQNGRTPLIQACRRKQTTVVRLLVDRGARINKQDRGGKTALYTAVKSGNIDNVKILLDAGADINKSTYDCKVPLHRVCLTRNYELLELLLSRGANVNQTLDHFDGGTVLHNAVLREDMTMVQLLVKYGASINKRDGIGRTALYVASQARLLDISEFLIENGANVDCKQKRGEKPLRQLLLDSAHSYAYEHRLGQKVRAMVELLIDYGARISIFESDYKTQTSWLYGDNRNLIGYLICHGCGVQENDNDGLVPMFIGHRDLVMLKHYYKHGFRVDMDSVIRVLARLEESQRASILGSVREICSMPLTLQEHCRIHIRRALGQGSGKMSNKLDRLGLPVTLKPFLFPTHKW